MSEAIVMKIFKNLTERGLEFHNEYEIVVARILMDLASTVENVADSVFDFEQCGIRRAMLGILTHILGSSVL